MKIVYLGSGEFGVKCLDALAGSNHNLDFIVTHPPHPAGRGRKPRPTPVADWAKRNCVAFIETEDVNTPESIEQIAAHKPQLIVVIAFGEKISEQLINLPAKGAINVHASLLPKYRGAAPINWAIIKGEKQTGISIITLADKMDAGLILAREETDIADGETADRLHGRLTEIAPPLLLKTIDQIADGTVTYTEQDHSLATRAPKLKKSDGFLDFAESAEVLRKKIPGFWPWPGASAIYVSKETDKCKRVTIAATQMVETSNPAHLQSGILDNELNVICGENSLKITKIKPADGKLMDFADFINGHATQPGDLFMKIDD